MTETITTINPATGIEISQHTLMNDRQVSEAVAKCHDAHRDWRRKSFSERGEILKAIGNELRNRKTELSELMTSEMGKLIKQSRDEIQLCAGICDWTATHGPASLESEERELQMGKRGLIAYEPIGVIYGIQPWNYPAYQVVRYSIANLMAGNGVLLKHASNVTGTGVMLADIYRAAGLPEHLFQTLVISHEQSDQVISNELVRGVTLTGSPDAGSIIAEKAGKALKKAVLELGSNDAYIVLEDADLEQAIKTCVQGRIYNNGETCIAAKRFIVVEPIYEKFRDAFVAAMRDVSVGDPTAADVDMGPMARQDLRDDLHNQVLESVAAGASILCGGEKPEGPGFYYPATVLDNVTPGQPAYDDELFGPVAALIRASDADDAMRIANDSRFGLGGGILSQDVDRAVQFATDHFDTGMVFINGFGLAQPNMPFGGVKNSGYGREHGGFGMHEFVNVKAVMVMN